MKRFPAELEAMLSPKGRQALAGKQRTLEGALGRGGVVAASGLFVAKLSREIPSLLERTFDGLLEPFASEAPPAEQSSLFNAQEKLPPIGRGRSLVFGPLVETRGSVRAAEIGLTQLLAADAFRRLAEMLAGAPLTGPQTMKVLRQGAGDYLGPSTGHLPEDASARGGYVELELSFGTEGIRRQYCVHERGGHLSALLNIDPRGGLIAWKLPRWRYTTPLEVSRPAAHRWSLSHTYYYVPPAKRPKPEEPPKMLRN